MKKERLDVLVQRRAGVTSSKAQGLIRLGQVRSQTGERLDKPGARLPEDAPLEIREGPRFVGRGGEKLLAALEGFQIDARDVVALDVGASTGGFTDCLLQHGAARVYAVDVGYGQLAWRLRQDPRVTVLERTNIRHLTPDRLDVRPDFFVADCSFISLALVLPPLKPLLCRPARGVVLIKPQFEVGKELVEKGGVVRDEALRQQAVRDVLALAESLGYQSRGVMASPLRGPAGNKEFLAHLRLEREGAPGRRSGSVRA